MPHTLATLWETALLPNMCALLLSPLRVLILPGHTMPSGARCFNIERSEEHASIATKMRLRAPVCCQQNIYFASETGHYEELFASAHMRASCR